MEARVVDFAFAVVLLVVVVVVVETKASHPPPPPPPHTTAVTAKGWNFMIGRSDDEEEAVCTVCLFVCLFVFVCIYVSRAEDNTTTTTRTNHPHRHQRKDLITPQRDGYRVRCWTEEASTAKGLVNRH